MLPSNRTNMAQAGISNRRTGRDRRVVGTSAYAGPERRKLNCRRTVDLATCIYCGKLCGDKRNRIQKASIADTIVENQAGVCIECSSKRFPQFYTDD